MKEDGGQMAFLLEKNYIIMQILALDISMKKIM